MTENSVPTNLSLCQADFLDPIPGVIPFGTLVVVAGASGAGKTILLAEWVQRMRTGKTICGHPTNPQRDYYVIAADRDWSTYHKAYSSAGYPQVKRYVLAEDPEFDPQSWGRKKTAFTLFERCIAKLNPIPGSWVHVDPVAPLFIQGSQNDARDVALSLHWYRKIAKKYQITLVLFANVGKQKAEDTYRRAQDRIAGSGAFVAYSDTQISIEQDEDGVMSMQWTPRSAPAEAHQFKFNPKTGLFAPYMDAKVPKNLPKHLAVSLAYVPQLPEHITSPDLVRKICESGTVKRAMSFRHIQQLVALGLITKDDLGVIRRVPSSSEPTTGEGVDPVDTDPK